MNSTQIRLVRESFARLEPDAASLTDLLYARWFQLDPKLRERLPLDLNPLKQESVRAFAQQVHALGQPAQAQGWTSQLYEPFGFSRRDYLNLGAAMLWTLEQGLGESFTPALADAWFAFFVQFAVSMAGSDPFLPSALSPPTVFASENPSEQEL